MMQRVSDSSPLYRVLLVGEESLMLDGLSHLIGSLPYPVEIERVGGIDELAGLERAFNLVILGNLPPGSDYTSVVRDVKAMTRGAAVAILVQTESATVVRSIISAGAAGVVPTSAQPRVILHAIELMLSGGVYLPLSVLGAPASGSSRTADTTEQGRYRLTRRQEAVLRELAKGLSNKQIATALGLSEATVKVHIAAIMKSLRAHNRTQAVITASEAGIL
jgi:DNA-binding NarL/FixJ family response regulator